VLAGRVANAVLAGLVVVAVAWAVRRIVPAPPAVAVAAAGTTALTPMLLLVGSAVYNDLLTVLCAALALGVAATAIRRGLSTRLVVGAAVVVSAGMLSRLTFVVFAAAVVVAVALAAGGVRGRGWNGLAGRTAAVLVVVAVPTAASGWFWLRNIALTGNVAGSHPEWSAEALHRAPAGFADTVLSRDFHQGLFGVFRGNEGYLGWTWLLLFVPLALGLVALVVRGVRCSRADRDTPRERGGAVLRPVGPEGTGLQRTLVVLMLVTVLVLLVLLQVLFVMQGGRPQTRYGLPIMTVLVVPMAIGLASWGRVGSAVLGTLWAAGALAVWLRLLDLDAPAQLSPDGLTVARVSAALAAAVVLAAVAGGWTTVVRRTLAERWTTVPRGPVADGSVQRSAVAD
jgi:4-amino-4-deoxy-L-arabinose transferase-like glycosyltransferase